jgi:predicted TIM-barrel fold metal-dependent hydrolase
VIFDTHIYPIDVGELRLSSSSAIRELMAQEQIDHVLLVSRDGEMLGGHVDAIAGAYGMLWVDPRSPSAVDEARQRLAHPKFRGLKVNAAEDPVAPDDPLMHPLFELAGEFRIPLAFHCGHPPASMYALPWMIEKAAIRFPEVRIVLVHMGLCVFEYHEGSMDVAERCANVYLDVSGMPHSWRIKEAVERLGADRVVYASSAPWFHPRLELMKVRTSNLAPGELEALLGGTGASLFLKDGEGGS